MAGELFKYMAGLNMVHVPYKGSTAAHPDVIAGRVPIMIDTIPAVSGHVKGGALRGLAVTSSKRAANFPDMPTMSEAGVPGYEASTWGGCFAPAGTPANVIAKLNAELNKALSAPDVRARAATLDIEIVGGTPQRFGDYVKAEMAKWIKVAKVVGIQAD